MYILRTFHKWLGGLAGIFLVLMFLSGSTLIFRQEILALSLGIGDGETIFPLTVKEQAHALDILFKQGADSEVKQVIFPQRANPYFTVVRQNGAEEYYSVHEVKRLEGIYYLPQIINFLEKFHTEFLGDSTGKTVIGIIGLSGILIVASGIMAWFPGRKGFRVKHIVPSSMSRLHLLRAHRSSGIIISLMLLFFSVTGVSMIFSSQAKALFSYIFDNHKISMPAQNTQVAKADILNSWEALLAQVHASLPHGTITVYYPPNDQAVTVYKFRLRYKDNWLPKGQSYVRVYPGPLVSIKVQDSLREQKSDRLMGALYPLHSAAIGGDWYKILILTSGLSLIFLAAIGLTSWFKKVLR